MDASNRREMTRVPFHVSVTFQSHNKPAIPGNVTDVSLKGIHVACDNPLPVGSACQLTLQFGSEEDPVCLELGGTVVRVDRDGMAIEIDEVLPIDTLTHLQNVVRYNATDTDRVDHELHDHIRRRWKQAATSERLK